MQLFFNYSSYLLLLDSIRQCEGVAKLLQNSSGKDVPVKPVRGNNKVAPGEVPAEDNSPVTQVMEEAVWQIFFISVLNIFRCKGEFI